MTEQENAPLLVNEDVDECRPSPVADIDVSSLLVVQPQPVSPPVSQPVLVVAKATLATRLTLFACVFSIAIDYAVVMPSIWLYLQSFDPEVPEYMLGLAIGSFSFCSFVLQFPLGLWLDRRSMREVLVVMLWVSLVANLFYFAASSPWMVIATRFFCGTGTTIYLIAAVFIVRTTSEAERSEQFSYLASIMMVGMIVGPGLNYPLTLVPRRPLLGGVELNSLNVVGLVLAGVFAVLLILVHGFFEDPPRAAQSEERPSLLRQLRQVIGVDTGSLLVAQFVALFNQTSIEVIVPPVVVALYGFGQLYTSLLYMGLTVYMLVAFLVAGQLSKRVPDRVLVLCGWLCVGGGTLVLLLSDVVNGPPRLWQFAFGCAIFSTSSACFETSVPSLFSKLATRRGTTAASQGSSQSLLMTLQSLAILIGPLAAAPLLNVGLRWVFTLIAVLWLASFVFFLFSFRHLAVVGAVVEVTEAEDKGLQHVVQ